MSYATPPGWYPDTGAPGLERWWDGTAWTAHTRPLAAAPQAPPPPAGYGPPSAPLPHRRGPHDGPTGGNRTRILAVTLSGALVLAPAPAATSSGAPAPDADPAVLVDQLNGITLPVPEGWERPETSSARVPTIRTEQSYDCPGGSSFCYHGTISTHTAAGGDTPEEIAEADIATAADLAYEEDGIGRRLHGGIRTHKVLEARETAVAGRTGYLVRWQVTTGKGPGGYVQSLAFPSSVGSGAPVIVRFAFDAGVPDLPLSLMDTITRGIRPVGDSATSGGVGASVGP
ncbi:DUF2510 domain-containing protein [Streptomyces griseus]|uniref:DUF2510 domain-containing protein n=1 Tax=Streptomyces griseus TaxID=1911 RepID=UPI0006A634FE|nr:DUF2510 domain-containing protein [Streptomyces griseus]KOG76995.1 hypothetical protein ADK33_31455 [Streptomyces griseus subsp. rhodochrous]